MANPWIIVTGADASYFELLAGLVASLRNHPASRTMPLGVLDCGLEPQQRAWLVGQGALLVEPGWDFDFPARDTLGSGFKAWTARPHLPRYFPGHPGYLWLDADCWVQDWAAIELMLRAARRGKLAVVPEVHPAFRHHYYAWPEFAGVCGTAYVKAYGRELGDQLIHFAMLNDGVFALCADAPHWQAWSKRLGEGIRKSTDLIDQLALNYAVHLDGLPFEPLPARCNWPVHHAIPAYDCARRLLVEPTLPHEPIGIVHLTIYTKWQAAFEVRHLLPEGGEAIRPMSLRYVDRGRS